MVIAGEWLVCDDGVVRPVVLVNVQAADGTLISEFFLVDTCADRTALSANLLSKLGLAANHAPAGMTLQGIGGTSGFVVVSTVLVFTRDGGSAVRVSGSFAAFTDPAATDRSILGREVLDLFDVIVSRQHDEVLLLAPRHQYRLRTGVKPLYLLARWVRTSHGSTTEVSLSSPSRIRWESSFLSS